MPVNAEKACFCDGPSISIVGLPPFWKQDEITAFKSVSVKARAVPSVGAVTSPVPA